MQKSLLTILAMLFCGILFSQQNPSIINLSTSDAGVKNYAAQTEVNLNPGYLYTPSNSEMNAYIEKHTQYVSMFNNTTFNQLTTNTSLNVGTTAGSVDIGTNGSATYSIPLTLPMGKAGISPNLSITYNSLLGDDLLGKGWTLAGLSAITVSNFDWYNDNQLENTNFSSTTKFAMDGTRLLAISGVYGANNTVYSTEQEGDVKIVSYGSIGSLPSWFTVQTKDGKTIEYGNSVDSKVINESGQVIAWKISKVYDLYGNYMIFGYINNDNNHRISSIKYTGNSVAGVAPYNEVKFVYQTRNDVNEIYQFGYKKIAKQLLEKVVITTENEHFKTYVLSYGENLNAYLVSIQEQGADYSALNPTYFNYGTTTNQFLTESTSSFNGLYADMQGARDFNGDGLTDILLSHYTYNSNGSKNYTTWEAKIAGPNNTFSTYASGGIPSGYVLYNKWFQNDQELSGIAASFDFYSDGQSDVLLVKVDYYSGEYTLSGLQIVDINGQNQTYTYTPVINGGGYINPNKFLHVGDFDGNGSDDLLLLRYPNASNLTYSGNLINVSSGVSSVVLNGLQYLQAAHSFYKTDIDGDLKEEIAVVYDNSIDFFEMNSQPVSGIYHINMIKQTPKLNTDYTAYTGDFNGDGRTDFLYSYGVTPTNWQIDYHTNNGVKTVPFYFNKTTNLQPNSEIINLNDFNGDGKVDICHVYDYTGPGFTYPNFIKIDVFYSKGITFSESIFYSPVIPGMTTQKNFVLGDFNGDSKVEIIDRYENTSNPRIYYFKKNSEELYLTNVKDGFLRNTIIDYDWISKGLIYVPGTSTSAIINDAGRAFHVVKNLKVEDGINGFNNIDYSYKGAKWHRQGKGFMGFEELSILNQNSNTSIKKKYSLKYNPLINTKLSYLSLDEEIYTNLNNNQVFNKKTYEYLITQISGIRYRINLKNTINFDYVNTTESEVDFVFNSNGNLISKTESNGVETIVTTNTFETFGTWWIPSVVNSTTTTITRNGQVPYSRTKTLSYNSNGSLYQEIIDPTLSKLVTTTFIYDNFGNVIQSSISSSGLVTRNNYTTYDYFGRFITSTKNSLNQITYINPNRRWGKPQSITDISGLTTSFTYNGFGLTLTKLDSRNNTTNYSINWDITNNISSPTSPINTLYYTSTSTTGLPTSKIWYDRLEREVKTENQIGNNQVFSVIKHNQKGNVISKTEPFTIGQTPIILTSTYDDYSRPTVISNGTNTTTITYNALNGIVTSTTSNQSSSVTKSQDASGKIISSNDGSGTLNFTYYSNGLEKEVISNSTTLVKAEYDSYGRQNKLIEANSGTSVYEYDAFGQLISQTDANNNQYIINYDVLGREISKNGPEGTTTSTYINSGNGINKINSVSSPNGVIKQFSYDSYDRVLTEKTTVDNIDYIYTYTYNNFDQIVTIQYPNGFISKNIYSTIGELSKVTNNSGTFTYYELPVLNQRGQLVSYKLGNGKTSTSSYDNLGLLTQKNTPLIQNYEISTNQFTGNISFRKDYLKNLYENFDYDNLNRLIETERGVIGSPLAGILFNIDYEPNGNISFKDDAGNYIYDPNKINAVTQVDNPVNVIPSLNQTITYSPFDRPQSISEGTKNYTISYGPDLNRVKSVLTDNGNTVKTKFYIGHYEKEIFGSTTREINYILTGDGTNVAIVTENSVQSAYYLYKDHLGSINAVTNNSGTIVYEQSFDAWGRRRSVTDWSYSGVAVNSNFSWVRGFTGHEQLDDFGLINMNNRLYDPILGRMLAIDNFVQNPLFLQSYNRYSYCFNNPLACVDPSGEVVNFIVPVAIGFTVGAISGGIIAHRNGQPWWQGAIVGGIVGAGVGFGIGIIGSHLGVMTMGNIIFGGRASLAASVLFGTQAKILGAALISGNMSILSNWAQGNSLDHVWKSAAFAVATGALTGSLFAKVISFEYTDVIASSLYGGFDRFVDSRERGLSAGWTFTNTVLGVIEGAAVGFAFHGGITDPFFKSSRFFYFTASSAVNSVPGVGYSAMTWGASLVGWGFLNMGKINFGGIGGPNNEGYSYIFKNYGFDSNSDIIRGIPFSANKVLGPIGSFAIQLTVNGLFNDPVQYLFTKNWWNEQYNYYH